MDKTKFKDIEKKLDSSIRMKLNQLRTFLELGKASVMVGAGFSKNAEMGEDVRMKDWGELCEDLYAALYNAQPCDRDFRLKSALRLAQQIESTMGRSALDEIIKDSLPNDSISPGYLHKLLVSLNWRDIFTTNYDSLLENAAVKAYRHYNIVTSKDSLIYQPHPRIVKLHGSFPDNRPFIITEEDYRTYPERFPEFVNTIRQALIETQFCLIGFSGDDPNFISWLGWFRDIMGQQMRPIYMIYVGQRPHDSEIKLLSSRKIELVITADISSDPVEALDFILSYIGNIYKENNMWRGKLEIQLSDSNKLKDSINMMRKIRESYPGWIILPADKIESDFDDCRSEFAFMGKSYAELGNEDKLNFLYEYTWRLQISFMPSWLEKQWYANAIQEILNQYDTLDSSDKNKADYLSVALLQIHRIIDDAAFCTELQLFRTRISPNSTSLCRRLYYEEALWSLSHCQSDNLNKLLASWDVTPDDYRGVLWKSKILREIDKNDEAQKMLEDALGNARRKLMSNSESEFLKTSVTLISDCLQYFSGNNVQSKGINDELRFWRYYEMCKKEMMSEEKPNISHVHGFNLGTNSTSWNSGPRGYIRKYVGAGRYYLLTEAYGQPVGTSSMTFNSEVNQLALSLIAEVGLDAALLYLVESNDRKALEATISRKIILDISEGYAIKIYDSRIKSLEQYMESEKKPIRYERELNVILPMLSRFCVWLDYERILKIIKFIWKICDTYNYSNCSELLTTCYNSIPQDKSVGLWWDAMTHPIPLGRRKQDVIRPKIHIKKWEGNESIVKNITEGLSNDSLDIRRAAVDRFGDVHSILPKEYQNEIDNVISENFDKLLNTDLISILGIDSQTGDNRVWKDKFRMYLQEQISKFIESDFKTSGSSVPIATFDAFVVTFINCYRHLTEEQVSEIFKKVLDFLEENYEVLRDTDDSESLFGGLKRFLDEAMEDVNIFISRVDVSSLPKELRNELLKRFKLLNDSYPFIRTIVRLSFIGKSIDINESIKDSKQFIKNSLEKYVISSDHNRMKDAFFAAAESQRLTKGGFSIQTIVRSSIDHIRYHLDSETNYILLLMPLWINPNIIAKRHLGDLFEILSGLPQKVIASEGISAELKSDILYYGGQLVGQIYKKEFQEVEAVKIKCVESWQSFATSHDFPHDIRNGYFKGIETNE